MYPFNNDYMYYDYDKHRYILTKKYITDCVGIDVDLRFKGDDRFINRYIDYASSMIYNYICDSVDNSVLAEYAIAKIPECRNIIMQAMGEQFAFICTVGDTTKLLDREKQKMYIDLQAKSILNRNIPSLGHSLLYSGSWYCLNLPSYEKDRF